MPQENDRWLMITRLRKKDVRVKASEVVAYETSNYDRDEESRLWLKSGHVLDSCKLTTEQAIEIEGGRK